MLDCHKNNIGLLRLVKLFNFREHGVSRAASAEASSAKMQKRKNTAILTVLFLIKDRPLYFIKICFFQAVYTRSRVKQHRPSRRGEAVCGE